MGTIRRAFSRWLESRAWHRAGGRGGESPARRYCLELGKCARSTSALLARLHPRTLGRQTPGQAGAWPATPATQPPLAYVVLLPRRTLIGSRVGTRVRRA